MAAAPGLGEELRVGFFPGDNSADRWGREIHPWSALATGAIEEQGGRITFLNLSELCNLPRRPELDVVHLNWPQSLANPESHKRRKYLPKRLYRGWFLARLEHSMRALEQLEIPVVWQVHDLPYCSNPAMLELQQRVFERFWRRADGLLFYERSAQAPVFEMFGDPGTKFTGVAHLGGYLEMHGPATPQEAARKRLGLGQARKVFLYPGTVRWSRSPLEFLRRFLELSAPEDVLIVTGRGTKKLAASCAHARVLFKPGMVGHDEFRDMICASDFVINDAYRYLGSAIIRVAMGYGVPVIARSFGCTSDIARGAYIEIEETPHGLDRALELALTCSVDKQRAMRHEALERHRERPWSGYGKSCVEIYRRLIASERAKPSLS